MSGSVSAEASAGTLVVGLNAPWNACPAGFQPCGISIDPPEEDEVIESRATPMHTADTSRRQPNETLRSPDCGAACMNAIAPNMTSIKDSRHAARSRHSAFSRFTSRAKLTP
jgi:hypothetical protein